MYRELPQHPGVGCDDATVATASTLEEIPAQESTGLGSQRSDDKESSVEEKLSVSSDLRRHNQGQIDRMIQVYDEIFKFYLGRNTVRPGCWDETRQLWQSIPDLEKFLKWGMANLVARVLDQTELPPKKNPDWPDEVFAGWPQARVVRLRLLFKSGRDGYCTRRQLSFAWSLLQGKAGSLPVDESFRQDALADAVDRLTNTHDEGQDELMYELEQACRRVVEWIYPRRFIPVPSRVASRSASYESGRTKGGTLGTLLEEAYQKGLMTGLVPEVLEGMSCSGLEFYTPDPWIWDEVEFLAERDAKKLQCRPIGLLEPFKVRVITVGTASEYHLMRRIQPVIYKPLRDNPILKLVGKPLESADASALRAKAMDPQGVCRWLDAERFWVSGDYEAATDYLNPHLSWVVLSAMAERIPSLLKYLSQMKAALVGHEIEVPDCPGEFEQQVWGQLMGSPISFPVLCLVNLAATLLAYEHRLGQAIHPSQLPVLINGDDVGFYADQKLYGMWKRCTAGAGLKFSLGKNYTHPRYLILNSQVHDMKNFAATHVPHLLSGCLWGMVGKSSDPRDSFDESPLAFLGCVKDLHKDWPDRTEYLTQRFVALHWKALNEKIPRGMSWYAPPHLGGLGLPRKVPVKELMTKQQLRLAKYLWDHRLECPLPRLEDLNRPEEVQEAQRLVDDYHRGLGWVTRELDRNTAVKDSDLMGRWASWSAQGIRVLRTDDAAIPQALKRKEWVKAMGQWKSKFFKLWKVAVKEGGGNLPREAWNWGEQFKICLSPRFDSLNFSNDLGEGLIAAPGSLRPYTVEEVEVWTAERDRSAEFVYNNQRPSSVSNWGIYPAEHYSGPTSEEPLYESFKEWDTKVYDEWVQRYRWRFHEIV